MSNPKLSERQTKNIYKAAIKKYGKRHQMDLLIEECAELIQAVNKIYRNKDSNILEELADVEIMIEQTKIIMGSYLTKQIALIKQSKLKRLKSNLND